VTQIIIFSRTTGYRHPEPIELGIELVTAAAGERGIAVVTT